MSDTHYLDESVVDAAIDDDPFARVLWPGDEGGLPQIAREVCVVLLRRTHLWSGASKKSAQLWQAALDYQDAINARLNAFFLELHLDERNQIAYKLQVQRSGGQPYPTLLYDATYNREEVEVLLHLRREHDRAATAGDESAYVDRAALMDMLQMSRPDTVRDHKAADTRAKTAIDKLGKEGFLLTDAADPDRLRISPFIETLLSIERIDAFRDALLANTATDMSSETDTDDQTLMDDASTATDPSDEAETRS
ncbi:DUF4194 domain-containing protein [Jatrophihabitans fulvus]